MSYSNRVFKHLLQGVLALGSCVSAQSYADSTYLPQPPNTQQVFFVGNNWDGTVTVIHPSQDFGKVGVVNMIPDRKERLLEIHRTYALTDSKKY